MTRFALVFSIVAPLAMANAQGKRSVEPVRDRIAVTPSAARTTCTVVPHRELYVEAPISHSCRVVSFDTLPHSTTQQWSYAVQRHTSVYRFKDAAGGAKPDTIVELETIVFSSTDPKSWLRAVLRAREEEALIRSITPDVADYPGGARFSVEFCVNGTGGCWQEFWRYDREGWYGLEDPLPAIRERVMHAFAGDSSHQTRAPRIDVRTLRGTAQIAARGDANCCPSDRAEFQLALDELGSGFRVVQLKVVANDR